MNQDYDNVEIGSRVQRMHTRQEACNDSLFVLWDKLFQQAKIQQQKKQYPQNSDTTPKKTSFFST